MQKAKRLSTAKYMAFMAVAITLALVVVVIITRTNKTVAGVKQIHKVVTHHVTI